jgi:flavin-dependent dehydrogenase
VTRTVERFDETFDVVVVGYGYSGAISALEAARAGAKVLLIEKGPVPGDLSICS